MSLNIKAEIKIDSEPCVVAWDNKLYVGTEEGTIKSYDANLTPSASWSAHAVQLFALAAGSGHVYSSSNDGGVRVWTPTGEKITELQHSGADIGVINVFGNHVYTGDEVGFVTVFENHEEKAMYSVLEEVRDLQFSPPFLFTVRDLYVTVTEIKPSESKDNFITQHVMEGRGPVRVAGNRVLVTARGGNSLQLHDGSLDTKFKKLHEVKVSDMILTSLAVIGDDVWTGGWDGCVRRWKIANDQLTAIGQLELGGCINALVAGSEYIYAAVTGGKLVCIGR